MTNLKDKIKKLSMVGKAALVGLGLATLVGTFGGNQGGLSPIYNKKVGTWGGINLGIYTEFQPESKFYGISLSFINNIKDTSQKSEFYGAQIGVGNNTKDLTGAQIGVINFGSENKTLIFNYENSGEKK